jgi:hypothetical protein
MHPPPSLTGWLITIGAVQHVWKNVSEEHNTFGAIFLCCSSNNNPSVGQFVDALKTVIINGLAYRSLYGTNCEEHGASLLDKLHTFLKPSNASSTSPPTSHCSGDH